MRSKPTNHKRAALQQYWHEGGFTGIYLRAALRTMQFASAIIIIGIYGSELHYRSNNNTAITNEIFALVVGLLAVFTVGLHCFLTVKRVSWVLWDFVMCVLYAALAGTYGGTYLVGSKDMLLPEERVHSLEGMKAAIAFDLFGLVLWLFTFLQGSVWCCKARRFTRRTDVEEVATEASGIPQVAEQERPSSSQTTLYAASMTKDDEKVAKEMC